LENLQPLFSYQSILTAVPQHKRTMLKSSLCGCPLSLLFVRGYGLTQSDCGQPDIPVHHRDAAQHIRQIIPGTSTAVLKNLGDEPSGAVRNLGKVAILPVKQAENRKKRSVSESLS